MFLCAQRCYTLPWGKPTTFSSECCYGLGWGRILSLIGSLESGGGWQPNRSGKMWNSARNSSSGVGYTKEVYKGRVEGISLSLSPLIPCPGSWLSVTTSVFHPCNWGNSQKWCTMGERQEDTQLFVSTAVLKSNSPSQPYRRKGRRNMSPSPPPSRQGSSYPSP